MQFRFVGQVIEWRGPSPYFYVEVPDSESAEIRDLSASVSYGWGAIPVEARIGKADFTTSLFPRDGHYLLPLRDAVRKTQKIALGDHVAVDMRLRDA
jgi:hypothetical protein